MKLIKSIDSVTMVFISELFWRLNLVPACVCVTSFISLGSLGSFSHFVASEDEAQTPPWPLVDLSACSNCNNSVGVLMDLI